MTADAPTHNPADWSDLTKPEYSGRLVDGRILGPIGNADYLTQEVPRGHPDYVMSRSEMKNFAACPARWIAGYREGATDEKDWGSQLDCLIFTPQDFSKRFVVTPETYAAPASTRKGAPIIQKKWNSNATVCQQWKESHNGASFISHADSMELLKAKRELLSDARIAELLECSDFQVLATAIYEDFVTEIKVRVKGCVDIVPRSPSDGFTHVLADLKSTSSAHPAYQDSDVARWWSDAQGALYLDLFAAAGDNRSEFRHVLQENYPPYQVGRRFLSVETLRKGREKYHAAMKLYCQCLKSGKWPSHEEMNEHRACVDGWLATEPTMKYE